MMKNIILCDCKKDEVESLKEALDTDSEKFEIKSHIANWKRTGKFSEVRRYGKYFCVAFKYFLKRKNYNVIIGWQQFYVLIIGFFCSLFYVKKRNVIIALNFTYKEKNGRLAGIYRWFMQRCLETGYIDYIHVPSQSYARIVSKEFRFPIERVLVFPFGINDPYEKFSALPYPDEAPSGGYALSIGRSNRDYAFLISAWKNVNYSLVIISDTYKGGNDGNENIRIINNVAGEKSYSWIAHCDTMIIPIDDGSICSGDTVLLTSMAMKKKIIITKPSTLAEMYVIDGENGLCVHKSESEFETVVKQAIFSEKYDNLRERARKSFLDNYSRSSMGSHLRTWVLKDIE